MKNVNIFLTGQKNEDFDGDGVMIKNTILIQKNY